MTQNNTTTQSIGVKQLISWLWRRLTHKFYYLICMDYSSKHASIKCISVKCPELSDIEYVKQLYPDACWIECGPVTYWLAKHSWPRLAMLSFWR